MLSLESLTQFLGWCTVINFGLLLISTLSLVAARPQITKIHAKMFPMDENALASAYFQYLAQLKVFTIVFNLAPYVALKMMS